MKVIDKIRKLQRHADSARELGNVAEAEAFAARAQRLLIEHHLSQESVDAVTLGDEEFSAALVEPRHFGQRPRKGRIGWSEDLATIVARAHFCRLLVAQTNTVIFVGRREDLEVAVFVFCKLARAAARLAREEVTAGRELYERAGRDWPGDGKFRASFLLGFSAAIHKRYEEQRAAADADRQNALVLKRDEDALLRYLRDECGIGMEQTTPAELKLDMYATRRGFDEGQRADLSGRAIKGEAAGQRQLA